LNKTALENISMLVLWILLYRQYNDFLLLLEPESNVNIFDFIFNVWFAMTIVIIFKLLKGENIIISILKGLQIMKDKEDKDSVK